MIETAASAHDPAVGDPSVEVDPKRLKVWLDELPQLSHTATLSTLLAAVKALNETNPTPKRAMALLTLYRESTLTIFDAYDSVPFQRALDETSRPQATRHLGALLIELQVGFNRIVRAGAALPGSWDSARGVSFAAYAALDMVGKSMLHSYRTNTALVPGLFRELAWIYRTAQEHAAAHSAMPHTLNDPSRVTLSEAFRAILLFHVCDPLNIPHNAVIPTFLATAHYAPHCRLGREKPESAGPIFVIDIAGMNPPIALDDLADRENPTGRNGRIVESGRELINEPRYLDLNAAIKVLKRDVRQQRTPAGCKLSHTTNVLERLEALTPAPLATQTSPNYKETPIRAVLGLDSIHHFLKGNGRHLREALQDSGDTMQIRLRNKNGHTVAHKLDTWLLSVEPKIGYRLRQPGVGKLDAVADELIGLTTGRPGAHVRLDVGQVTWARYDAHERLQLGVRPISKGAVAVTCTNGKGVRHQEPVACLHIERSQNTTGVTLLLAPADTCWENTQVMLELDHSTKIVKVGTRRSDIASLACYELPGRSTRG
ncbi:MAG: hypothetical protein ACI8PT_002312 [Gammaproteobacteria bacterium]|jgi:hypothetical protein